jgi:hypothetical protein
LEITVDTASIDEVWGRDDVRRILRHINTDGFYFRRTPGIPNNDDIAAMPPIPNFTNSGTSKWTRDSSLDPFRLDDSKRRLLITTARSNARGASRFGPQRKVILTDDENLLLHRDQLDRVVGRILYSNFRNNPSEATVAQDLRLNIATPKEVIEIMGLFRRKNERYELAGRNVSKSRWLNYITLLRLPHLGHDITGMSLSPRRASKGGYLSAIRSRVTYLIAGLDHIGSQYFTRREDNSGFFDLSDHVDYCLSLVTSLMDNLALYANEELNLGLNDEDASLTTDRIFLSELNSNNHNRLFMHVHQNHHFTNMAYEIRNGVIHREGVMQTSEEGGGGGRTTVNGEQVPTRIFECHRADLTKLGPDKYESVVKDYNNLSDSVLDYDRLTRWGSLSDTPTLDKDGDRAPFDPYQLIKTMVDELLDYADKFLKILGHDNILEELSGTSSNDLTGTLESFQKYALTPFVEDEMI